MYNIELKEAHANIYRGFTCDEYRLSSSGLETFYYEPEKHISYRSQSWIISDICELRINGINFKSTLEKLHNSVLLCEITGKPNPEQTKSTMPVLTKPME